WRTTEQAICLMERLEALIEDALKGSLKISFDTSRNTKWFKEFLRDKENEGMLNHINNPAGYISFAQLFKDAIASLERLDANDLDYSCEYLRQRARREEGITASRPIVLEGVMTIN